MAMKKIISIFAVMILCACAASGLNAQTVAETQTIDATGQIAGVSSLRQPAGRGCAAPVKE